MEPTKQTDMETTTPVVHQQPEQDVVDKGQWSDDGEGKWQQSDDGEGKWQQSDDDGRDGQGADDGDDSASFPENSDEDYDELPWFIDEEDISQPPGDGEEFLQMILNAEHREQEQAVLRPESTPGEMPGVNDDLLEDVDIEEQFLIHGTLLDDIRPQAAQVLQLEQYSSDLAIPRPESIPEETPEVNNDLLEDVDIEEQFLIHGTLSDDIKSQAAQLLQVEQYCSNLSIPQSDKWYQEDGNYDDLCNVGLNTKTGENEDNGHQSEDDKKSESEYFDIWSEEDPERDAIREMMEFPEQYEYEQEEESQTWDDDEAYKARKAFEEWFWSDDTETIPSSKYTRRQQLMADSKLKLEDQVERMAFLIKYAERCKCELQKIVQKCHGNLQKTCKSVQQCAIGKNEGNQDLDENVCIGFDNDENPNEEQSGQSGGGGSGDQSKEQENVRCGSDEAEIPCEGKLRILLDIEEQLITLQHNEDGTNLWEEIRMRVQKWWLGMEEEGTGEEERHLEMQEEGNRDGLLQETKWKGKGDTLGDLDYTLRMMWKSNDSIWMMGFDLCGTEQIWFPQKVWNIMQQICRTPFRAEQISQTLTERQKLLATFQERFHQWQNGTDSYRVLYQDMKAILEDWKELKTMPRAQRRMMKTRSTGNIDKVGNLPSSLGQQQLPPIRRLNSEPYLFHFILRGKSATKAIPSDLSKERASWQLVAESKDKLRELVQHEASRLYWVTKCTYKLMQLLEQFRYDIHKSRKGRAFGNALVLRTLLKIEVRLRMLQHSENMLKMVKMRIDLGKRRSDFKEKYSLGMMWNSNDSVWLLGFNEWDLRLIQGTILRKYTTDIPSKQYPNTPAGREQLLVTFHARLEQWLDRMYSQQHRHKSLKYMLECWPEHRKLRNMSRSERRMRSYSAEHIEKVRHSENASPETGFCERLVPTIKRSKSEGQLFHVIEACRQGVKESKEKLHQVVQHKKLNQLWAAYRRDTLSKLLSECSYGLQPSNEGKHEVSASEGVLRRLFNIEEQLIILQQSEDCLELWEKIRKGVREWCLWAQTEDPLEQVGYKLRTAWMKIELDVSDKQQTYQARFSSDVDHSLEMMWKSKDSVWLLGCDVWSYQLEELLQRIRYMIQKIYPTYEQHSHTPMGIEWLLAAFQQRLQQWTYLSDTLQCQLEDLKYMSECWPEHNKEAVSRSSQHRRTQSTSRAEMQVHDWENERPIADCQKHLTTTIKRSKSEGKLLDLVVHEALFSVAIEAAFPQCAIVRLPDSDVLSNSKALTGLKEGQTYSPRWHVVEGVKYVAGSQAEGLAVEKGWGHPDADKDNMVLYGGPLGVHLPHDLQPPECAALRYRPEGCPPAYCKIEVTDVPAIIGLEVESNGESMGKWCLRKSGGVDWLHTHNTLRTIRVYSGGSISGPANQEEGGIVEYIPALVCSAAHPDITQNYVPRPRHGWPSQQQLQVIKKLPMLLVLTGHKLSNPDEIPLQARCSWSHSEMALIIPLPLHIKQVYIALKYAFKCFMKIFRGTNAGGDGRSHVGSYYLKTVLLHHLENKTPTMIRSQLDLFLGLLYDLDRYLEKGKLPHYFLQNCDLLETVGAEERQIARNVINHILHDPLRAILKCPTDPEVIYGDIPPESLVAAFHQVSSQPTNIRSREELLILLHYLDVSRRLRYQNQQEQDVVKYKGIRVTGRPELQTLVDMLWEHIHEY